MITPAQQRFDVTDFESSSKLTVFTLACTDSFLPYAGAMAKTPISDGPGCRRCHRISPESVTCNVR